MFTVPAPPENEVERLEFLKSSEILDTPQDERFDRVTRLAAEFYSVDVAFLVFVDGRDQWMKSASKEGLAPWIRRDNSVCQIVISSGEPLVVGNMQTDLRLAGHSIAPHLPFKFYAGLPLLTKEGEAIALLRFLKHEAQKADIDLSVLKDLAAIAMDELELWRLNWNLSRLAETDALTGLSNRRRFDDVLDVAMRRAHRTGEPYSLLFLDIDHFKRLNDVLGHQAGDDALRRIGPLLSAIARRPDDLAARYGGKEFALILAGIDAAAAADLADQCFNL